MHVVSGLFLIAGALFTMIGGLGVVRFNDVMSRMHAAAKVRRRRHSRMHAR